MHRFHIRLTAVLLTLLLFAPLIPSFAAEEPISRLTVTFFGDPKTTRGFTWYTSSAQSSEVQLTKEGEEQIVTYYGYSGAAVNETGEFWHKAGITDLLPGATYSYRVGSESANQWSQWRSFQTAEHTDSFTFIALTDTQAALQWHAQTSANTLNMALSIAPDAAFVIHSGDVVDKGRDESMWQMTLDEARSNLGETVIVPAAGNHEPSRGTWFEHFHLPVPEGCDTTTGGYYSFTYGLVHVVTLNTNESGGSISNLSDAQIAWLKEDIAAARANGALRVVVNLHKGMYSLGPYAVGADIVGKRGERTLLSPLLQSLGVDLVLQGHDHFVSRTAPLWNGSPSRLGVTYLNTGTAGVKAYNQNEAVSADYLNLFAYTSKTKAVYGGYQYFAVIHVDEGANLFGEVYQIDYQQDPSTPILVDTFSLPTPVNRGDLPFYDVAVEDDFADAVQTLYSRNIMTGTAEDRFEPETELSRAMLVTLLHRLAGEPTCAAAAEFSDVTESQWYTQAVSWAWEQGYVQGYGNGLFGTADLISREQLAAILYRYAAINGQVSFAPSSLSIGAGGVSDWAQEAFAWAVETGVLAVHEDSFSGRAVTRGEAAAALAVMLELTNEGSPT